VKLASCKKPSFTENIHETLILLYLYNYEGTEDLFIFNILLLVCLFILVDIYFFKIGTVGGAVQLGPLGTAATNRPIVPNPRVIMMMEKLVE
jgi:hypothetical protein